MYSSAFLAGFLLILTGHTILSSVLQYAYYRRRARRPEQWKIQATKVENLRDDKTARWWLPLLSILVSGRDKKGRHHLHGLFASFNILMASLVAGMVTHLIAEGKTKAHQDTEEDWPWGFARGLLLSMTWQCVLEYYWHRFMHLPGVYARLHKYHHYYKSPEPFDDLFIHPVEAMGYYLQLYSPPFLISMPISSFVVYLTICGICGVLDHSGVALEVPGLYDTADHDRHHSRFEVNYAFPFPVLDILHGTYEGTFLGRQYTCRARSALARAK